MTFKLFKCPESVESYRAAGKEYVDHLNDNLYSWHQQLIKNDPNRREIITSLVRVRRYDNSEWLTYSEKSIGTDSVYGKRHVFARSGLGQYIKLETETVKVPNPEFSNNPTQELEFDLDNKPKDANISAFKEIVNVIGERVSFSIPFTKENADKLHKKCVDKAQNREDVTTYLVAEEGGITITVQGPNPYDSFRNADFEELFNYGMKVTPEQRYRIDSMRMNKYNNVIQTDPEAAALRSKSRFDSPKPTVDEDGKVNVEVNGGMVF